MREPVSIAYAWSHPYVHTHGQSQVYLFIEISGTKREEDDDGNQAAGGSPIVRADHVMLTLHMSDRAVVVQTYGQPFYEHFGETTILAGTVMEQHVKTIVLELCIDAHDPGIHPVMLISAEYLDVEQGVFVHGQHEVKAAFSSDPELLSLPADSRVPGVTSQLLLKRV